MLAEKHRGEIRNPGGLFGGITIADLRKGHVSKRRNPLIADLFRRIEMVEAWGRGMPLILKYEPDVKFREMADIFVAAFDRPSYRSGFDEEHSPVARRTTVGETVGETVGQILSLLRKNPNLTRDDLRKQTGLSVRGVEWNLAKMKKEGLIKRIGPAKGGHWEVLK